MAPKRQVTDSNQYGIKRGHAAKWIALILLGPRKGECPATSAALLRGEARSPLNANAFSREGAAPHWLRSRGRVAEAERKQATRLPDSAKERRPPRANYFSTQERGSRAPGNASKTPGRPAASSDRAQVLHGDPACALRENESGTTCKGVLGRRAKFSAASTKVLLVTAELFPVTWFCI